MSFLYSLATATNRTRTENNAATNKSTLDAALDFFALAGAMRNNLREAERLFRVAYAVEPLTALRTLFYLRDIRGGQGEREVFRQGLRALREIDHPTYSKVLNLVPEYGRWDDLWVAGVDSDVLAVLRGQLTQDLSNLDNGLSVSLLAKWLPSENTSSQRTRRLARKILIGLDWTPKEYRQRVVALRKHIKLLEQDMSSNNWEGIEFGRLPSQAHRKHVKAFRRHVGDSYQSYLDSVARGDAKINTQTLYTYEVYTLVRTDPNAANVMWDNLPDYTNGQNAIVVADVSGSMSGQPMSVSVSLALYFAERNQGRFNGYFMTFSERPQLVQVTGRNLQQKLWNIEASDWGMNTDIEKVFDVILQAGQSGNADEMPAVIYIVSDMEFDSCTIVDDTIFEHAQKQYAAAGFKLPHIVFWNVNARHSQVPATKFDNNVTLVSGLSQSTFRYVMEGKSPRELMEEVVNSDRYQPIELAGWND